MKYHLLGGALEDLRFKLKEEGPKAEHDLGDDLKWDHIDNMRGLAPVAGRDLEQED